MPAEWQQVLWEVVAGGSLATEHNASETESSDITYCAGDNNCFAGSAELGLRRRNSRIGVIAPSWRRRGQWGLHGE
jgi:hypothetical protein